MKNVTLQEKEPFVENLLNRPSFNVERKKEFKARLYNQITTLNFADNKAGVFTSITAVFFKARFALIAVFSFAIILVGIAILPSLSSLTHNTSNSSQQSQNNSNSDITESEKDLEVRLSSLDHQVNHITLDDNAQLLNEQDITLE